MATNVPSYDIKENYELLETVGGSFDFKCLFILDSVLKFIISAYLMLIFPEKNEDFLTDKRIMFIKNKLLTIIAVHNDLHFFLKLNKRNANEWRPPLGNETT